MEASLDVHERHLEEAEFKEKIKMEWQHAALVIDRWATSRTSNRLILLVARRLLLWIFIVATISATFGILYMSPHTQLFTL